MKKKYLLIFPILAFLVTACIQDSLPNSQSLCRVVTVTAHIAEEQTIPNTKISLEQDILDIILEWEEGDKIALCIVANEQAFTQDVDVTIDPENKKKASFTLDLPGGEYTTFDLYGMYGGGGFKANTTEAILPDNPVADTEEGIRKDMVLTFAKTGINASSPNLSVNFSHLGSIFRILVNNTDATNFDVINGIKKVVIASTTATPLGVHINNGAGTGRYDVSTGNFSGTKSETTLTFELPAAVNLNPGTSQESWGWFIPTDDNWPALRLKLLNASDGEIKTTTDTKGAKSSPTALGKTYHFFADYDNTALTFSNVIKGKFTDPRDGNVYKTVKIGDKIVMAENLRFLESVVGPDLSTTSTTVPYCYVYGYDGTNVTEAKAYTEEGVNMYQTYGVLYNWPAALIVCPKGWHLPSHAEYQNIFDTFGGILNVKGNFFKSIGNKSNGFGLWNAANTDATNISGFTALPAGRKEGGKISCTEKGDYSYFYTSTADGEGLVRRHRFRGDNGQLEYNTKSAASAAYSIRCVKD